MKIIDIRGLKIGEGQPKIIVPIVEENYDSVIEKAKDIALKKVQMVEWRADYYDKAHDINSVLNLLKGIRGVLGNIPLLFTFRNKNEGGVKEISSNHYTHLNKMAANSGYVDLIDVEVFSEVAKENIDSIHDAGVLVVGSYHDFYKTPSKDEIILRLRKIQEMGADIGKVAVMPQTTEDVLTLLEATNEMSTKYANRPIITMAMGPLGVISRISGQVFGSSMTFGALGQVSAPGQIPLEELSQVLGILSKSI